MLGDDRSINTKQFSHRLLGSPNVFVLVEYLYAVFLTLCDEGKELRRTISYFKFLCHDAMGISCHEFKGNANE